MKVLMTSSFIFGDFQVENQNLSYFEKVFIEGKIERLIKKMT